MMKLFTPKIDKTDKEYRELVRRNDSIKDRDGYHKRILKEKDYE